MVFEVEVKEGTLRMDVMGSIFGFTIEDSDVIMAKVINQLLQEKRVTNIVLSETREYEYDVAQTQMLKEIAYLIEDVVREKKLVSLKSFGGERFGKYVGTWYTWLYNLVTFQLRGDPIGAYVNATRELRHVKAKLEAAEGDFKEALENYAVNVLLPLKDAMENLTLIKVSKPYLTAYHIGDRKLYREILKPTVRPNFMFTKFMIEKPVGETVDKYTVGDSEVEIFKIPGKVRYIYHIVPPEFRLSEEEYTLLDGARRILEERKPQELEIKEQERMRELFQTLSRELIRELAENYGFNLAEREIEKLATILTRYTAGLGVTEPLLADNRIQDIYLNPPLGASPLFIFHQDYEECETNLIPTKTDGERLATRFKLISERPLDEANPVLDTEITVPGGVARIAAINPRLSPDGLGFAIRRHRYKPWTFPLFMNEKMFDPLFAGIMWFVASYGRTVLIGGSRGSGKTSMLNAFMLQVLPYYRIITSEDTLEIAVDHMRKLGYNITRLKSRSVITKVELELPAEEAIRTALRLGDSCLFIGEVRSSIPGWEEVLVIENGLTKRIPIGELESKNIDNYKIPTLGFDLKIDVKPLAAFVKHPERTKLLEIVTRTGRHVTVTPDHSLFKATHDFCIVPAECKDLKKGDSIVIPSSIPVGFNDVEYLNVMDMLPEFRLLKFEKSAREAIRRLGWKAATKIAGVASGDIYNYFRSQRTNMPISSFKNIMDSAGIGFGISDLRVTRGTGNSIPAFLPVNEELCRFLGYYISEGYSTLNDGRGGYTILTNSNPAILADIANIGSEVFGLTPRQRLVEGAGKSIQLQFGSSALSHLISRLGCGRICTEKRIPPLIFGLSKPKIAAFLKGLFSGDGTFTSSKKACNLLRYSSTSEKLIEDLAYLLLAFNIVGSIRKRKSNKHGCNDLWNLEVKDREMIETFMREIGFTQRKPQMIIRGPAHTKASRVHFDTETLEKNLLKYPRRYRHLFRFQRCSKRYLKQVVNDPECIVTKRLKNFANGDFFLDEIKEIREIILEKPVPVYDLSVEPSQNFVGGVGGILLHNTEAKALFEAMRIGAMANVVAGTVHGENAYGIYDRIVNDLGVVPTSFKAVDLVAIANKLKTTDGLRSFRRVTELTEVRKHWKGDPMDEGGFVNLMSYSSKDDKLIPSDTLLNGESQVLNSIAMRVPGWAGRWDAVWDNINLRGKVLQTIVNIANDNGRKDILEADYLVRANQFFHIVSERVRKETGEVDPNRVYNEWLQMFKESVK